MHVDGSGVDLKKNRLKEMLKKGEVTLGTWVTIGHPDVAEILANLGFDWLVFDTEHSPMSMETVQTMIQATSATQITPIVRVAWNDLPLVKRALDIGAYGVIVPMVNSKEEALNAVRACKYPPVGIRGVGPRRPSKFWTEFNEYFAVANEEIMVVVQVETAEAVDNLEEILSVDGVDAFFIGPSDLSVSMGLKGDLSHPKLLEMIERALATGKKIGVPAGIFVLSSDWTKRHIDQGFQFISIGSDTGFLMRGSNDALARAGKEVKGRR